MRSLRMKVGDYAILDPRFVALGWKHAAEIVCEAIEMHVDGSSAVVLLPGGIHLHPLSRPTDSEDPKHQGRDQLTIHRSCLILMHE